MPRRWVHSLVLWSMSMLACDLNQQATQYRIHVHCQLPDGKPVAGVQLNRPQTGQTLGTSDAQGNIVLMLEGREGQDVDFTISSIPATLALAEGDKLRHVTLKKYGTAKQHISDVKHEIRLRPKKEKYVILVSAEQAPLLPVSANGAVVAHLNSRSAAAFRIEGKPGDELKVTILASQTAKVKGTDPAQSFTLPEGGGILSFHSNLFIKPEVVKAAPRVNRSVVVKWGQL